MRVQHCRPRRPRLLCAGLRGAALLSLSVERWLLLRARTPDPGAVSRASARPAPGRTAPADPSAPAGAARGRSPRRIASQSPTSCRSGRQLDRRGTMARIYEDITEFIGNTPLVRLNRLTEGATATVVAKLEFYDPPTPSRTVSAWRSSTRLRRPVRSSRRTIVEATSGNTGIALAFVCAARGYNVC